MKMKTLLFNLVFYRNLKTYLYLDLFPLEPFPDPKLNTKIGKPTAPVPGTAGD